MSVVTGAFGYTGRYIAQRLLSQGQRVKSLTGHPDRPDPFGGQIDVAPLDFGDPDGLARSLEGAVTLYNTYWVRFQRGPITFDGAVENSRALIRAAEGAGVARMVHISIANASPHSPLPYYRGKGLVEEAIGESSLSYAIIRPTVVFGKEDVLINNIVWALRRFPVFPLFGTGEYRLQPIHVDDLAQIAVGTAPEVRNQVIEAAGPETYTFAEMLRLFARVTGSRARLVRMKPVLAYALTRLAGLLVDDVVLTRDEVDGLVAGLLTSPGGPAVGTTRLSKWAAENADQLGRSYASELSRHYR